MDHVVYHMQLHIQTTRWHCWQSYIYKDRSRTKWGGLVHTFNTFSLGIRGRRSLNGVNIYCCRPAGWVCGEPASCRTSRWGGRRADGSLRGTTGDTRRNSIRGRRSSVRRNSSKTSFNLQSSPKQSTTLNSSFLSWGQPRHYEHLQETMWRIFTVTIIQNPPDTWFCLILIHFVKKKCPGAGVFWAGRSFKTALGGPVWPQTRSCGVITTYMKDLQPRIDPHMNDIMTTYPIGLYLLKYWRGGWGRWQLGWCALLGFLGNKSRQESQWELIVVLISITELAASAECGCFTAGCTSMHGNEQSPRGAGPWGGTHLNNMRAVCRRGSYITLKQAAY